MNQAAVLHLRDDRDCVAIDRNRFLIRLRAEKGDLCRVYIHVCDKYLGRISKTPLEKTILRHQMKKVANDTLFDYFEIEVYQDMICFRYFFELVDQKRKTYFYGNDTFHAKRIVEIKDMYNCAEQSRFEERMVVPAWAKGAIGYQIFPDRFSRLEPKNPFHENWEKAPLQAGDILGGELKGITAHLDYLRDLGIDYIYLNPIFLAASAHKYDTIDYRKIDPSLGTKKDFIDLVKRAHHLGIRVIIDGVFNHTGVDFFAFQDLLKNQEKSRFRDWYYVEEYPLRSGYLERPNYLSFSYFGNMPKLNTDNPKVRRYLFNVVRYWMRVAKIDGWRLDVADEISHSFWREFRQVVKEVNPDALIVGEIWYDAYPFLKGDEWDSAMNYPFYEAITNWLGCQTTKPSDFLETIGMMRGSHHPEVLPVLWNFLDCHDTPRFLSYDHKPQLQKIAAAIQMTIPGSPLIYYGNEVGLDGAADPDCRRGMLWDERQNRDLLQYYRRLIRLRKTHMCLSQGDFKPLHSFNRFQVIAYARTSKNEELKIVVNASDKVQANPYPGYDLLGERFVNEFIHPQTVYIVQEIKKD